MGNSVADEQADLGTRVEAQHRWWKRVQPIGDWEEDVLKSKDVESSKGKTRVIKPFVSSG